MPPKKIKNKIYENQKDWLINPAPKQIKQVWNNKVKPIDNGWIKRVNNKLVIIISGNKKNKIQRIV